MRESVACAELAGRSGPPYASRARRGAELPRACDSARTRASRFDATRARREPRTATDPRTAARSANSRYYGGSHVGERRSPGTRPRLPSRRAFLAVCRPAGAADRRGAGAAESRAGRGAVRASAAAVFRVGRVSAVRRTRAARGRSSSRAGPPSISRFAPDRRCATAPGSIPQDALKLRDLFDLVGRFDATEVLVDDRPVPYARELWLPLIWFLIR